MSTARSRLLIRLVLFAAVLLAVTTSAYARPRGSTREIPTRTYLSASVVIAPSGRTAQPASGEPDTPAQKIPPTIIGGSMPVLTEDPDASGDDGWLVWISRIWMARFLGVSWGI